MLVLLSPYFILNIVYCCPKDTSTSTRGSQGIKLVILQLLDSLYY